jgi:tight adherence protein B
MKIFIAILTVLIIFSIFAFVISSQEKKKKQTVERIEYFSSTNKQKELAEKKKKQKEEGVAKQQLVSFIQRTAKSVPEFSFTRQLDDLMEKADWPFLGKEYLIIMVLTGVVFGFFSFLYFEFSLTWLIMGFIIGFFVPRVILSVHISRRQKAFVNQLGDMLEMCANALHSGFSFMQAFELIAQEMDAPIGREAEKMLNEVNVGATLETAMTNMEKRVSSPDFNLVVTAVLVQRQVGGNLAEILNTISSTIEERVRMRREVVSLTAQGRMSGWVLLALPWALALFINWYAPGYFNQLLENDIGKLLCIAGVVFEVLGYITIRMIVNIKF